MNTTIEFSAFTSIFELLCAYNLVNSINDSQVLKFLNFTVPIKDKVQSILLNLDSKLSYLVKPLSREPDIEAIAPVVLIQERVKKIGSSVERHNTKSTNFYLIGGIYCFLILLFSGYRTDFYKINSLAVMSIGTALLYFLFEHCDFFRKKSPHFKRAVLVVFIGAGIILLICLLGGLANNKSFTNIGWVILIPIVYIGIILVLFRSVIIRRKFYKGLFSGLFLVLLFTPSTQLFYDLFYTVEDKENVRFGFIVISMVIAVFPFLYDILQQNYFQATLSELEEKVKPYDLLEKIFENNILAGSDLDPLISTSDYRK